VVDPKGQPVEGAVVVAQWVLEGGLHVDRVGILVVKEAVTDASGAFRIEGWGPIKRPLSGVLDFSDPTIAVMKPGGLIGGDSNYGAAPGSRLPLSVRDWRKNGKTIRLSQVDDSDPLLRSGAAAAFDAQLFRVINSKTCQWTQIPKALAALERELARVGQSSTDINAAKFFARTDCGPLQDFKRDYEAFR
jgi:hypothetical protein